MKNMKKIVAAMLAVVVLVMGFSSCSMQENKPRYKNNADGCALYRYKSLSTEKAFTVPDEKDGKAVTELMRFSIANAEYLEELTLGKNITTIQERALENCPNLKKITVSEENQYFKSVDGVLYNKDMTKLLCYPNAKSPIIRDEEGNYISGGDFVVPDTVKEIAPFAFYLCSNLYNIEFNEGLEKIDKMAFIKCTSLAELHLPSTVTEIGVDAFSYCDSLKRIEIPSSVQKVEDYAFFSTISNVEKIIIHQDKESDIAFGKNWEPNIKNTINGHPPIEYVGKDK